jgi:Ca2+-binding EF-hand superfamily protein
VLLLRNMLSTDDVKDIEQSFQVLDDSKVGTIDMDRFYTLWLGLGFDPSISKDELAALHVPQDRLDVITLDDVLTITSRVRSVWLENMCCMFCT